MQSVCISVLTGWGSVSNFQGGSNPKREVYYFYLYMDGVKQYWVHKKNGASSYFLVFFYNWRNLSIEPPSFFLGANEKANLIHPVKSLKEISNRTCLFPSLCDFFKTEETIVCGPASFSQKPFYSSVLNFKFSLRFLSKTVVFPYTGEQRDPTIINDALSELYLTLRVWE